MKEKIKIQFQAVYVKPSDKMWGLNEWNFVAKIDGVEVGNSLEDFEVTGGIIVDLPDSWSAEVEISGTKEIPVFFQVWDEWQVNSDLGSREKKLKWPFTESVHSMENERFVVWFEVEVEVLGEFEPHHADEVFACRNHLGKLECVTVSGKPARSRIEVCEVWPTPPASKMPQRLKIRGKTTFKSHKPITLSPSNPPNKLPNPAVIPILNPADADNKTAARIQVNFYQPRNLKLKKDDSRIEWEVVNLVGNPNIKFVGKNKGLRIFVYGRAEGEVRLEAKLNGVRMGIYRAIVRPIKKLLCRVTILDGGKGAKIKSTPQSIEKHIKVANLFLRQAGVFLDMDNDNSTTNGAVLKRRGIFKIDLPMAKKGDTRNVPSNFPPASRYNYRNKVLNIVYIHSRDNNSVTGTATAFPKNKAAVPVGKTYPQLTDEGTPSTSWIKHSGVWPHQSAQKKTLEMNVKQEDPVGAEIWSLIITNASSNKPNSKKGIRSVGSTLAHEVGHVLTLCHREASQDLLTHPEKENLMYGYKIVRKQDLDIIQAKAIYQSSIFD